MIALTHNVILAMGIYCYFLTARAIFSWLHAMNVINSRHPFVGTIGNFLFGTTEPVLAPVRRFLPNLGCIDISPIIVVLIIPFIRHCLLTTV
ncbi:YggT family protein [Mesorhizobium sp. WSM2239]|uniref:YggT family protein n=2 Tax=unclassified Mesorhizobium TaxID=325217 RepID=A0AAU8D9F3_9HYPH